jgi:hypothetical protein
LPVPVSPSISTVESVAAMRGSSEKIRRIATLRPSARPKKSSLLSGSSSCSAICS